MARRSKVARWLCEGKAACILIVLDECHSLRRGGRAAEAVEEVVEKVRQKGKRPLVLYSSATAASSPSHLSYLSCLGMWGEGTSFSSFRSFGALLTKNGSAAMELVAIQLKAEGKLVARHLSHEGVKSSFLVCHLGEGEREVYDACAGRLSRAGVRGGAQRQAFFQRLLAGFKVRHAIRVAREEMEKGRSVILCVQGTGEAAGRREEERRRRLGMVSRGMGSWGMEGSRRKRRRRRGRGSFPVRAGRRWRISARRGKGYACLQTLWTLC